MQPKVSILGIVLMDRDIPLHQRALCTGERLPCDHT